MLIEVIADSYNDAQLAEEAGADRIELVTGIAEGGLTPSYGLIEKVCQELTIPVNVMIRPHSKSFCYSKEDIAVMLKDIEVCKQLSATGVVLGALTMDHEIDIETTEQLVAAADGLDITFHRAFDEVEDQVSALPIFDSFPQITRILTSGGKASAIEGSNQLEALLKHTENRHISIMAGAGLTEENIGAFLSKVRVNELHFGSGVRSGSNYKHPISTMKIKRIREIATT